MADGPPLLEGVDYAWSRPNIEQLAAAGKVFACRYGGPGSIEKQLDPAEAQALSAAGISIVANAEGAADGLLGGWSVGNSWARSAEAHFATCGMPPGKPIYFSVDFDVQSGQWAAVAAGLRGAAEALGGVHRVGVYGSRRAMEWARRDGVAQWFWQTYAWSGGIWASGNHIEQYRNGVALAGATLDLDRALETDFGQWMTGVDELSEKDSEYIEYDAWRGEGIANMRDTIHGGPDKGAPIPLITAFKQLQADVAKILSALAGGVTVPTKVDLTDAALEAVDDRVRDAVADLGDGGAAKVRADED